jgi:hypothetical protein
MNKPSQFLTARDELNKVKETLAGPVTLSPLKNSINALTDVISGDYPQIEKDIAKNLMLAYRTKVVSEVRLILANLDSYKPESLKDWHKIMEVFMDINLDDDPEFNECKRQLLTKRDVQSIDQLTPAELNALEKELRAALDTLSAHKNLLSNIKLSIRK